MPAAPRIDKTAIRSHDPKRIDADGIAAAVSIPILHRDQTPHLVFIERAESLDRHPGQMAFPGGRQEASESLLETAQREAHEEIGLPPTDYEVLGQIDDIQTVTGFNVTPFVVNVPDRDYQATSLEVADVAVVPVNHLLDPDCYRSEYRTGPEGTQIEVHYFDIGNRTVWGATGRILARFLQLASDWSVPDDSTLS